MARPSILTGDQRALCRVSPTLENLDILTTDVNIWLKCYTAYTHEDLRHILMSTDVEYRNNQCMSNVDIARRHILL